MPAITPEILASLQGNTKNIRNICILAHVDHGKTTLSDRLISSNGIISNNLAGKIRYLDVRPDEIERRITMKSSCISLLHKDRKASDLEDKKNQYLIHLIDSPGHVDFSSEVSTAVRLSDGGIVVVDVLEGVCVQTEAVLKQAWNEKLKVTLLLNKVDRLITELQMTPAEAYERINRVLEQVNAVTGRLFSVSAFKALEETKEDSGADTEEGTEVDWESVMKTEENVYFSPEKGNVCFGSALDGWGFSIETFVDIWVKKLGVKREILQKTLWGEFYFNTKTKKIHTKNFNGKMIPMFVQFVLNSIWEVYSAAKTDKTKLEKIVNTLQIKVNVHKFQNETPTAIANAILSKWLPIQDSVLQMVAEKLPSPQEAQKVRVPKIWQPPVGTNDQMKAKLKELETAMLECDPNSPEVVLFVSKIFPLPRDSFTGNIMSSKTITVPRPRENVNMEIQPQPQVSSKEEETLVKDAEKPQEKAPEKPAPVAFRPKHEGEKFVAFARIFCGTLRRGAKVHILGPRYMPSEPTKHHSVTEIEDLYMLMGREVESIPEVSAGNIFGIGGLEDYIIKTATVTTTPDCSTFSPMAILSSPIVRVAVEPENPTEKNKLVEGLKLLNQADPVVEIYLQETGEHVIVAAGELHLERCLRDLRENYARIKIQVSPPLVAFRETITDQPSMRFAKQVKEFVLTANKLGKVKVKAVPLPENIMKFLRANAPMIRRVFVEESVNLKENADIETFRTQLEQEFKNAGHKWEKELEFLWSFGPRRIGPNILLNHIPGFCTDSPWVSASKKMKKDYQPQLVKAKVSKKEEQKVIPSKHLDIFDEDTTSEKSEEENEMENGKLISSEDKIKKLLELENSIINGFQLATASGPLCEEPMMGVCFMVEEVEIREREAEKADTTGPFNGQIMSATKEACRAAFLQKSARLMEPMYSCEIQIPSDYMGKCYTVLGRRRTKILNEEVKEGGMFQIQSLLPVAESFGLSVEMLTQTSGSASVQLLFHNWELLDEDPFWEARTEEELEDIGANVGGIAPNVARKYMDEVRKRKGLRVEEQIVKFADKQRTLKKNK